MATRDPGAAEVRLVGPCNADCQFDSVIGEVEYLISYPVAVPELPSSPGAVQFRLMQAGDGQVSRRAWEIDADRLVIVDGGVVSPLPSGVGDGVGTGVGVGAGVGVETKVAVGTIVVVGAGVGGGDGVAKSEQPMNSAATTTKAMQEAL